MKYALRQRLDAVQYIYLPLFVPDHGVMAAAPSCDDKSSLDELESSISVSSFLLASCPAYTFARDIADVGSEEADVINAVHVHYAE